MNWTLLVNFTRVVVHLWEESGIISAFSSLYDQVKLKIEQTWAFAAFQTLLLDWS